MAITSLAVNPLNRLTLGGQFGSDVQLDFPDSTSISFVNSGDSDIIIIQLDQEGFPAGPIITTLDQENDERTLSIATRAGVGVTIESSDQIDGPWISIANIPVTTGTVAITTSDTNCMFRAITDW